MAIATVRRWGNSLAVRIPQDVSEKVRFTDGIQLEMLVNDEEQEIVLRPVSLDADDQKALRSHFIRLREKCNPGIPAHEEIISEPAGDETV